MPAMTGKSPLAGRIKKELGGAFDKHKNNEIKIGGGGDLPSGINGGVARLVNARIQEHKEGDNKGKLHLYLAGIVEKPEDYQGCRTQQIIKLYDTQYSRQDDGVAKGINETKKLGGQTGDIAVDDWEDVLKALEEEGPHFRFRTYEFTPKNAKKDSEPMIIHDWKGRIDNYQSNGNAAASGVQDNTGDAGTTSSNESSNQSTEDDWDEVVTSANGGNDDAVTKLVEACLAAGKTKKEVEAFDTWEDAAKFLKGEGSSSQPSDDGSQASAWEPEVGQTYSVKLKGMKQPAEFEVTAVFKETLNLKNPKGEIKKGIKWTGEPATIDGFAI